MPRKNKNKQGGDEASPPQQAAQQQQQAAQQRAPQVAQQQPRPQVQQVQAPPGFAGPSTRELDLPVRRARGPEPSSSAVHQAPQHTAWRAQQPMESHWRGSQQSVSSQQSGSQEGAKPKAGGSKNKYPKKERPATAPTPATQQGVDPRATSSTSALPDISKLTLSPTKALAMIESSPNGTVYQGTRGTKCTLDVNYLQLKVDKLIATAYHYDVEFDPDASKKMWSNALDKFMAANFKDVFYAFDGRKNFYTNKILKVKGVVLEGSFEQEVEAVLGDRRRKFKVKIQFAAEVDLQVLKGFNHPSLQHNDKPSRAIQCLDIILRTAFKQLTARQGATAVGRAVYFPSQGQYSLGEGMEMWLGLFQSAILGRKFLYLNVDVAHKAFPSAMPILNVLASFSRDGKPPASLDENTARKLKDYLKMLCIEYEGKTFGFNDLVASARNADFPCEDGTKMSVLDYFRRKKNIQLRWPDLPCLHVGSRTRTIYLPIELCTIPAGQATNKKCTPNAVAAMIKYSATSTHERRDKIRKLLDKITYSAPGNTIEGFGINVDPNFQKVEGRIINPPDIMYASSKTVRPNRGVWDDRGTRFIDTQNAPIKWGVINCDNRTTTQQINDLQSNIARKARDQGMNLAEFNMSNDYTTFNSMRAKEPEFVKILTEYYNMGYRLVFVVIIDMNDCYARFKQAAECRVGILTQCIKANTVFRMGKGNPMMTIGNIMLKVNAKLGGKNHEVRETSYQTHNAANSGIMFVGADVTHPGPDCRDLPSVVGVAASYDAVGFRYNCAWRLQKPTQEMIVQLEDILVTQLQFYKAKNGKLPGKIMYYRDGVSDGQFGEVLQVEMTAIRAAMKRVYGAAAPAKVTFVVVQKRHHTRFFPTSKQFADGKNDNVPAGTVVDKDIVHPFQYQFFMASHAAIQGVTKPAKYCVLVNESKISPDDLQAITYDLCHLFTRCNRSVSYPAPTYYAHLVAARGKNYTIGLGRRLNMDQLDAEYNKLLIRPEIIANNPMFFV